MAIAANAKKAKPVLSGAVRMAVVAADKAYAVGLSKALKSAFLWRNLDYSIAFAPRKDAEIIVYAFSAAEIDRALFSSDAAARIGADQAPAKIFLEVPSFERRGPALEEAERKNAIIAQLADRNAGYVMPLMSKFMRWETASLLDLSGMPTHKGFDAIAGAIAKYVDQQVVRRNLARSSGMHAGTQVLRAPRRLEQLARALGSPAELALSKSMLLLTRLRAPALQGVPSSARPASRDALASELLADFVTDPHAIPQGIRGGFDLESIRCFVDNELFFADYPKWGRVPFSHPIDWSIAGPNRSWRAYFLGLEFLDPVLNYLLAVPRKADATSEIAAFLARRGISNEDLLARAGAVIANFIEQNPPDAPRAQRAWHEGTVSRRLKNFLLFLLCVRGARRYEPDPGTVRLVHSSLLDTVAFLRSDDVYVRSGNHGVRQDLLLIRTGLLMRNSAFGQELLKHGLDRLVRFQIETGLTPDGVWLENSFGYHCHVMRSLTGLVNELTAAGIKPDPRILDAIARMSVFAEAAIKCDGQGPLLGDTEPKPYASTLAAAWDALSEGGREMRRSRSTYIFPQGGLFASHTDASMDCNGSSLLLTANLRNPKHKQADDLSLIFSHGAVDLLVDGGTYNKETSDRIRNAARFDPATHNSYRVNGNGYTIGSARARNAAVVDRMWEGDGWAACFAVNEAYADAQIARLAIHLKCHHALIVVDRLESRTSEACEFEQFWHIAPQLHRITGVFSPPLVYSSDSDGCLLVAFDAGEARLAEGFGSEDDPLAWLMIGDGRTVPTPYLRRTRTLARGYMAAQFQWAPHAAPISVDLEPTASGGVRIRATGHECAAQFAFERGNFACVALSS
jgi:hypothetical protein